MPAARPGLQPGGRFSSSIYAGFLCKCLSKNATLTPDTELAPSNTHTNLLAVDNLTHTQLSQQLLIEVCTRGTDQMHDAPYKCPACTGCKKCLQGSKQARTSPLAMQEQHEITSSIKFIEPTTTQPGHYICRLPLRDNYDQGIYSNQEGADLANQKLLKQLKKRPPHETQEISNSYEDLIKNGFITPLKNLPEDIQESIRNNSIQHFIPNTMAYKDSSHSTKVRICWDATRRTGQGAALNSQLLRGISTYSMTKSLLHFRRGAFGL